MAVDYKTFAKNPELLKRYLKNANSDVFQEVFANSQVPQDILPLWLIEDRGKTLLANLHFEKTSKLELAQESTPSIAKAWSSLFNKNAPKEDVQEEILNKNNKKGPG